MSTSLGQTEDEFICSTSDPNLFAVEPPRSATGSGQLLDQSSQRPVTPSGNAAANGSQHLAQQFIDLDYDSLCSEHTWDLWEEIISKQIASLVPIHFIIRFAGAWADNIRVSLRRSVRGASDPRISRVRSLLDYLSTSRRHIGNSEQVRLALVRVKHALLSKVDPIVAAKAELDSLWKLNSLDSPAFHATIFQAVRLIIEAQPDLSKMAELLIDYWDAVYPALIALTRFTDRAPGAFHAASALRNAVYEVFSSETRLWPWLSDRFSTWERNRAERLVLLFLALATQQELASEAANAYSLISQLGVAVPQRLLRQTIEVLIENGQFATALTALDADSLHATGQRGHYRLRMRLAAAMGDSRAAEDVYNLMDKLQLADHIDQTLLMQADAIQGNKERVVTLFNKFFGPNSGRHITKPTKHHYSTVITAHALCGDEAGASEWLKRMAKAGIPPDRAIYNSILRVFALRNDISSVAGVLKRMKKFGIERDIRTVTILVSMYARRGDPMSAEQVIRQALATPGFTPDRKLLNSLVSAHVNAASWPGVIRVFDWMVSMRSADLRPQIDTMNNVLKAYVYMGAPLSSVTRAFAKLKNFGLRPNARSYLMLIQSACDAGRMDVAWDAFNELEATATKQYNPVNAYILTLIMGGYLRNGDKIRARTIYEEMQARGIHPTAVSFRVILSAYANERTEESLEAAERFMASLLESSPDQGEGWRKAISIRGDPIMTVFAPLLVAHGRSLHPVEVEAKFRQMLELGAEPTIESFTLLMDAYRRVGNINSVIEAWEQLYKLAVKDHHAQLESTQKSGESIPVTSRRSNVLCIGLSIYIDALSRAGRHQDIALAWQKARNDGFAFDAHNWNHLAIALVRAGEPERAFEVIERVLIPYSQFTDRAIRARNRASPSLLTEDEETIPNKNESQVTAIKLRERARVMRSLTDRGVDAMLEQEGTDPTDIIQSLHILHQISPTQNLWAPHERTLVELAAAAQRLKRGLMVTPQGQESTAAGDVHSEAAYAILDRIKQECPNALYASLVALTRVRNFAFDGQEEALTPD